MRVNLSRNKLRELPVDFYSLPELRYLNISYNEFEELHPAVSDLHMLEYLVCKVDFIFMLIAARLK